MMIFRRVALPDVEVRLDAEVQNPAAQERRGEAYIPAVQERLDAAVGTLAVSALSLVAAARTSAVQSLAVSLPAGVVQVAQAVEL